MNNRWLDYVLLPFVLFAVVVVALIVFQLLIFATRLVEAILIVIAKYMNLKFLDDVAVLFDNPVRVFAIPIAVGLMIVFGYILIHEFLKDYQGQADGFVRGRNLDTRSRSRRPSRESKRPSSQDASSSRSSKRPSGRPSEEPPSGPSLRPNRRKR